MSKHTWCERLIAVLCIIAILLSSPFAPVSAESAETGTKVTATTNASVKQGNTAYCYVYIDSLESLSTLEVTVHFDPAVVSVTGSYNQVNALLYDASAAESTVQYTYIFDGNGENTKTQLFYFEYTVLPTAPVGETYFDLVVGDAYDASFETLPVSGSRCSFRVAQAMNDLTCHVSGISSVNTSVDQEFTLTYQFSTASIASGAAVIRYDPELFALMDVEQGGFLEGKLTDINTSLSGAVYLSFLGTAYNTGTQFLTLRFKTLQNVSKTDNITLTVTDLYDLELNAIRCSGYTTSVQIRHDATVDETAPRVYLQEAYDAQTQKLTVQVCLEENSHLGAGDFVLHFDTDRLAYVSAEKGYSPTFFNINDKNIDEGLLKFSVISMTDQTQAATMLTATFDVLTPCEDTPSLLTISGSGLADHLTNAIVLNFAGCTVETAGHTLVTDPYLAPTCLDTGLTEGNHCQVCQKVLLAQQVVPALGHDEIPHPAQAQTCTEIGWDAYVTCSRCDYTTYVEIPADGHRFHQSICSVCGATQEAYQSWDISAAGDGSLTAQLYRNHDGTYDLQITGSGAMTDWGDVSNVPWNGYQSLLTSLRLPEGLTSIGAYAFYGCTGLTELTLPESLQSIGNRAFYECTGLTQIRFNAVQMADLGSRNYVFSYCGTAGEGITVTIGSNVKRIPAYLFNPRNGSSYAPKLTAVEFAQGSSCQSIGSYAFYSCAGLTELTLPEGLQTIETAAFKEVTGMTQLTLPESLTAIGIGAFQECKGLTQLTLPANLQTIGDSAFHSCTGLTQIYFNATQMPDLKQGNSVFIYCGNATEGITVTVGSQVTRIPAYLFYPHSSTSYAPKLKAVTFAPDSVCQSIGSNAFRNGAWLTELTLPESLQTIGGYAFYNCTGLQTVAFGEGLQTIESYAFVGCAGLTGLALPQNLQTIGYYAFSGCTGLQAINLPEGLQTLNSSAFNGCTGLTRIDFNAAQMSDLFSGNYVFAACGTAGEGITVNIGSNVTRIPTYLFYPTGGTEYSPKLQAVTFAPDSVCQSIGAYAFFACPALQTVTFGEGLQTIEHEAFYSCTGLTELALPASLQTIGSSAFSGCTGLQTVIFGEGMQTIEEYAFCNCTGLQTVTFGEGLQTIGEYAFYGCIGLTELALPASLQTIESYAFGECTGLETINLPQMLQTLHNYAFYHCANLTQIRYDATQLADLENYNQVFAYCGQNAPGITVTVGSNVERIPACLFDSYYNETGAPKLKTVLFTQSSTCQSIGRYAFYNCSGLRIGFSAEALPATVGASWYSSDSVYYLNVERFLETDDALYVIFRDGTAALAKYTGNAAQYQVPETVDGAAVTAIGSNAFRNNTTLTQVQLPDSVTQIQSWAFYGCSALTQITIPENVTSIGKGAFYQCVNVQSIAFHAVAMADITSANDAFYQNGTNTEGITVTIGPEVTRIPDNLFQTSYGAGRNPKITSILFPENGVCQSIGRRAFYGLHALKTIVIPETVAAIGEYALDYCPALTIGFAAAELPASLGNSWNGQCGYYLDVREFVLHDDATYVIQNDNTAALGRYLGDGTQYEIAGEVGGAVVTRIGDHAFRSRGKLERVTMPQSIQSIGNFAFCYCTSLSAVLLSESVAHIGSYAFSDCTKLTIGFASETGCQSLGDGWNGSSHVYYDVREFVLYEDATYALTNDGAAIVCDYYGTAEQYDVLQSVNGVNVTTIGAGAFYQAQTLVNVSLPDTLTRIENEAFAYCTKLESITIPEQVTYIGYSAFYDTLALKQIRFHAVAVNDLNSYNGVFYRAGRNGEGIALTIGKQVTKIPAYLFDSNSSEQYQPKITQVIFEEGSVCKTIGTWAFAYITDFPEIALPESLETIGASAFAYTGLTSVEIPASVTTIGTSAFNSCADLTQAILQEGLTTLGANVFQNCTALTTVSLPDTLTTMGTNVFQNCTALTSIRLPDALTTIGMYTFQNCTALTEVHLPDALKTIESHAFYNCAALQQIMIPAQVSAIGDQAFRNSGLKLVYICSDRIASNTNSAAANGYLLDGVSAVVIRADLDRVSTYITDNYPNTMAITYQGVDYISYSTGEHVWREYQVLVPFIACQQDGCIRYICDVCGAFQDVTTFRHDVVAHAAKEPDCLNIGWHAYHTCSRCDYTTYTEIPALGHRVMVDGSILVDAVTTRNDGAYAFSLRDGVYSSTNQVDNSSAYFTITALYDCSLPIAYAVSSEQNYDKLIIRKNGATLVEISGEADWASTVIELAAGDVVTVNYHKDGSVAQGQDTGWFRFTCPQADVGADVPGPAEDAEPTCTEAVVCYFCQTLIKEALGHDLIGHEAQAVTCLAIGWDAYDTCSRCDYSTYAEIPALGHDLIGHEAQQVSCTEIGWDAYDTCSRCDYSTYEEIPALGHDLQHHEAQAPTCTEIGWDAYDTCSRCDYSTYTPIPALGHDLIGHEAQQVTCTEIGWDAYDTCSRCDYSTYAEIPALGHDLIGHEARKVSCTEIGWDAYDTCSRCDYTTYAEIPATGHWIENIYGDNDPVYPFVLENGIYASTNKLDATTSVFTVTAKNTCTLTLYGKASSESGCDLLIISHNGSYIADLSGERDWQQYTLALQAGDTVTIGYRKDGSVANGQDTVWFRYELDAQGRIPAEQGEPTCTEAVICSLCGKTMKEALGHDLIGHEAQQVTCTEIGWDAYDTCSRCDYSTYAEIPANGHSFMDKVCIACGVDQPATKQWDVSLNGDGSVMAYAYAHMDGTYLIEILGSGPTTNNGYPFSVLSGKIEDIYIGEGVTTLGDRLFSGLRIQGSIQIPESVSVIGAYAFYGFSGPKTVSLPASITSIGNFAFYDAKDLIVILQGDTLPGSLGSIWDYNCGHYLQPQQVITTEVATYVIDRDGKAWLAKCYENLPEFVAETSVNGVPVTGIGAFAFDQKSAMITYTVPAQITEIGSYAFRECNKLTVLFESDSYPYGFGGGGTDGPPSYLAPQKVIQLEDRVYVLGKDGQMYLARYFGSARHVTVEAQVDGHPVEHIGDYAFGNRSIYTLTLPDTIRTIGGYAFIHSTIKQISMPDSLTEIGTWGFFGADLTSVTIPENVVTIQDNAFSYCEYLKVVYVRSPAIARNIMSTSACGDLCRYAQTVVIPADVENTWLSEYYAYREDACVQGIDCVIYSNCAHDWQQTQISEMIPCQSDGVEQFVCSACTAEKTLITKCHDEIAHAAQIPNCTQIGWEAYDTCSRCDYSTYVEIPALGHDLIGHEAQAATCLQIGWEAYDTCSRCDYSTYVEIPALGHDLIGHEARAATCLEIGWEAYDTCSRCDYTTYTEIPALGHELQYHEAQAPTCTEIGWHAYHTCSRCDYTTYAEIPALGHRVMMDGSIWVDAVTTHNDGAYPFHFQDGVYSSTNRADNTNAYFTITALYDCSLPISYAVSSEDNYDKLIIRKNDVVLVEISGEVDWASTVIELAAGDVVSINYFKDGSRAYYEDTGWFRFSCPQVDIGTDVPTPAEDAEPTCTEAVVCYFCQTLVKEALGHDLTHHEARQVTCTEIGWDAYDTCSRCDYSTYAEILALGHDLVGHEAQQVTCLEIGWDAYDTCSRCDYSTYEEIPALGHDLQHHEAQAPTCTEIGWEAYDTCSRCDYTTLQTIPATGRHTFADEADTQCDVCGQVFVLIRFATNGGTAVEQIRTLPGQTVSLSGVPGREGYRFAGWSATKNGDVAYGPDDAVCTDKSITLYAQWNQLCTTCQGSKRTKIDCDSCTDGVIRCEIDCPYCLGAGLVCRECDSITHCTDPNNHGIDLCTKCDNGQYTMYQACSICNGVGYTEHTCTDCNEWGETIRADGAAPDMPVLEKVEGNTIVLRAIENGEYSLDGIHWQESPVFENLEIGAEYCFYQRYVKTDTTLTSQASEPQTVKLKHAQTAPEAPVLLDKTQNSVTLAQNAGYEYSLDGIHWQKEAVFTGLSAETDYTFYQRIAQTDTHYASPASMALTVTTAERTYVLGDINRDGRITAFDAQILAEANAGLRTLTEEQWLLAGNLSPADIVDFVLGKR